jgi:GntR family transcriptional regulator
VLDSSLDRPLYRQLIDRLRRDVAQRRPGERIASEPELAHHLGISRFTVAKAVGALVGEGLLVRRQGKGTFVATPPLQRTPVGLRSFTEAVRATGRRASSTLLGFRAAEWQQDAGHPPGEALILLERLRSVDGLPVAVHRSLLAASLVAETGLTRAIAAAPDFSLYGFLATRGLPIERGMECLSARRATPVERAHLRLDRHGVVMVVARRSFAADGRLLDAVEAVHDSRRYSYQALLQRDRAPASGDPLIAIGGRLT